MKTSRNLKVATALFVTAAVLDIIAIITQRDALRYFFKPMVLLSLALLYWLSSTSKNKWYLLALLGSFLGDVFLLSNGQLYFILGLGSFLLAHLFYIKIVIDTLDKPKLKIIILPIVIFLGFLLLLLSFLGSHTGNLLIPVGVYGFVISSFGAVSLVSYLNLKTKASLVLFIGALLFIFSDSTLAFNKFVNPTEILDLVVMSSYILAQYVIFRAVVLGEKKG
ncbi:MAG: lysoplasmalogenase [Flavobacteriaceae bacterium]|nr:lysoplasmalogenase [Flavobacteriaceae bacterium]